MKKIILFALPIALGSVLQQLFNAVDIAVVGRFSSSQALAAVGSNASVVSLLINLFVGISVGANVVISTYIGQRREHKISAAVHTSIVIALVSGIAMMILVQFIARPLLILMGSPEDVLHLAILYLKLYGFGLPFVMLYNFGAAILRSIGDSKRPLYCLVVAGIINSGLNLFFVIVCHMSVEGVALATDISGAVSAIMVLRFLMKEESSVKLIWRELRVDKEALIKILKLGIPSGLQGMVFSISNVCIQSSINAYGSAAIAGSAVTVNYEMFDFYMVNGFVQAAVTFTGQNYGAGQTQRCRKIYYICMSCGVIVCTLMVIMFLTGRLFFIGLFTTDAEAISFAVRRMFDVVLFHYMICTYEVSAGSMRGYGRSLIPSLITIFGTCVFRIIWINTAAAEATNFDRLLHVYPFSWIITGSAMIIAYFIVRRQMEARISAPTST